MLMGRIPHVSAHLTRSTPRTHAPLGPLLPFLFLFDIVEWAPFVGHPGIARVSSPTLTIACEIWENVVVVILSRGDRGSVAASKSSILPSPRLQRRPGCFTRER